MKTTWDRIHFWFRRHAPELLTHYHPGASEEDIRQAEEALGVTLPDNVKAAYRIHDGEDTGVRGWLGLLGDWVWLSLEDLVRGRGKLAEELALGMGKHFAEGGTAQGPVRREWYHPLWLPIAWGPDRYLCIDLIPEEGGHVGQVIYCHFEEDTRQVAASSFAQWLAFFAQALEDGVYTTSPEYAGLVRANEV